MTPGQWIGLYILVSVGLMVGFCTVVELCTQWALYRRRFWWWLTADRWYVPWRLCRWLDRQGWCWADIVTWKVWANRWDEVHRKASCLRVLPDGSWTCYCGHWDQVETQCAGVPCTK